MKTNQNEELQSRREFFKSAAKAALPVIGAVVLANVPIVSQATSVSGCPNSCGQTCQSQCVETCHGLCKYSCMGGCKNGCHKSGH